MSICFSFVFLLKVIHINLNVSGAAAGVFTPCPISIRCSVPARATPIAVRSCYAPVETPTTVYSHSDGPASSGENMVHIPASITEWK